MFTSDTNKSSIFTMMDEYSPTIPSLMPRNLIPSMLLSSRGTVRAPVAVISQMRQCFGRR